MSAQSSQSASRLELNDEAVADYLREDLGFFERHLDLLETLRVPHPVEPAVSLVERQLIALRERGDQLERKLRELIEVARENEQLATRMQRLALAVLEADSVDEVMAATQEVLRQEFRADFVVFRFTEAAAAVCDSHPDLALPADSIERRRLAKCMEARRPICGRVRSDEVETLFRDDAGEVSSAALLPLNHPRPFGLLGLGSRDPNRFNPAMGTLFLGHMGELVGRALARWID